MIVRATKIFIVTTVVILLLPLVTLQQQGGSSKSSAPCSCDPHVRARHSRVQECDHCTHRDQIKNWQLEIIKRDILRKLRLKAPPNISARNIPDIPQVRMRRIVFEEQMVGDQPRGSYDDNFHATNVKVMRFCETPPRHLGIDNTNVCVFKFPPEVLGASILQATLFIYIHHSRHVSERKFVNVSKYQPSERKGGRPVLRLVSSKRYQPGRGNWYHFNVRSLIQSWLASPNATHAIEVEAFDDRRRPLAVVQALDGNLEDEKHRPFIEIALEQPAEPRSKRMLGLDCDDYATEQRCCRYPLNVDFEEFQWDWIIAPKRYRANYCSGECPYVFFQEYPHTHIITQMKPEGAGPCCNPTQVSPIPLLYFNDRFSIISGMLPGMVVDRCGCS